MVLITDGPAPVRVFFGAETAIPVPKVTITDTIGAGDAFGGAFLAWWVSRGYGRGGLTDRDA